jgi:cytochrome c oxidase assembly factor CtaG
MTRRRRGALVAGGVLAAASVLPPVLGMTDGRLSNHMMVEMALVGAVVPLLVYGLGPMVAGRRQFRVHPVVGIVALNLVIFAAQLPVVVDAVSTSGLVRELVQLGIIAGALLFWWPIVGPSGLSSIAKIGTLMVAGVPPTIPGLTLALSHHLFYAAYRSIEDQQLAGLVLFGTAKFALVGGTFVVLWRMLTPGSEPDDRDDHDLPIDETPPTAPAWLRRLDEELPAEVDRPRRPVPAGR